MSKIIDTIQKWLEDQNLEFSIKEETFIIDGDGPKPFKYVPHFMISNKRFRGKTIVIEPITSLAPQGGLKRVQTFRHQFSKKYHVIIITKKRLLENIPDNIYDQLIEFENLERSFIKIKK